MTKKITIEELARIVGDSFSRRATKDDLTSLATKNELASPRTSMDKNFAELRMDIKAIHTDLIKHDERVEEMMGIVTLTSELAE